MIAHELIIDYWLWTVKGWLLIIDWIYIRSSLPLLHDQKRLNMSHFDRKRPDMLNIDRINLFLAEHYFLSKSVFLNGAEKSNITADPKHVPKRGPQNMLLKKVQKIVLPSAHS